MASLKTWQNVGYNMKTFRIHATSYMKTFQIHATSYNMKTFRIYATSSLYGQGEGVEESIPIAFTVSKF